jgi:hypothetical protein
MEDMEFNPRHDSLSARSHKIGHEWTTETATSLKPHFYLTIQLLGRSPVMVMYLLMKNQASLCSHEQNELLLEQLKAVKVELKEKDGKEKSVFPSRPILK